MTQSISEGARYLSIFFFVILLFLSSPTLAGENLVTLTGATPFANYRIHLSSNDFTIPTTQWNEMNHNGNNTYFTSYNGSILYPFCIQACEGWVTDRTNFSIYVNIGDVTNQFLWKWGNGTTRQSGGIVNITISNASIDPKTANFFGTVVVLPNGTLMAAYTSESGDGAGDGGLMKAFSYDNQTWSAPSQLHANANRARFPTFIVDGNRVYMFHWHQDGPAIWQMMQYSDDNASTWSSEVDISSTKHLGVYSVSNGIKLRNGRLLLPVVEYWTDPATKGHDSVLYCDSNCGIASSWHDGGAVPNAWDEPSVVELSNGSILMIVRPWILDATYTLGKSISTDNGTTWSTTDYNTGLRSSSAAVSILRQSWTPSKIIMAWDDDWCLGTIAGLCRYGYVGNPLVIADSYDEGLSFSNETVISSKQTTNRYPTLINSPDGKIIVSYYRSLPQYDNTVGGFGISKLSNETMLRMGTPYTAVSDTVNRNTIGMDRLRLDYTTGTPGIPIAWVEVNRHTKSYAYANVTSTTDFNINYTFTAIIKNGQEWSPGMGGNFGTSGKINIGGYADSVNDAYHVNNGLFATITGQNNIKISHMTNGIESTSESNISLSGYETNYYANFKRNGTEVTLSIFNDSSRTTHISESPITYTDSSPVAFTRFYPVSSYNDDIGTGNQYNATGSINEITGVNFTPRVFSISGSNGTYVAPVITIASPHSITYNTTSIALNVSANKTISTWRYSLNGVPNVTFTPNTTITAAQGANNLIVYASDIAGNWNSNHVDFSVDTTAPDSVTNLRNITYTSTYINWTWTDPSNPDFAKVMVYLNGVYKNDVFKGVQYYNATGTPGTYTIGTKTVDTAGNINATMKMHTAIIILPSIRFINGTVMDSITKEVLPGVTVSTTGASTTSNATGFYSLKVASGTYPVVATYDIRYYSNSSVTVSTASSAVLLQDIELLNKPTGNISGSVTKV